MNFTVDQLSDLENIKTLSARYARGLDQFSMADILAVFAEDAEFDASPVGLGVLKGVSAIEEFFAHNQSVMSSQMHLFGNFIIEFDGPTQAHGTNYLLEDGYSTEGAQIRCLILNEDTYAKDSGRWLISKRTCRPLVPPQLEGY